MAERLRYWSINCAGPWFEMIQPVRVGNTDVVHLTTLPPLSLYIHIPWCVRKCPYCDFNSHEWRADRLPATRRIRWVAPAAQNTPATLPEGEYIEALITDLESMLPSVWGRRVHTIFFGGGTPSVFAADSIDRILTAVRTRLVVQADAEITLEANPGTVDVKHFEGYRAAGVNRVSLGIQSFDQRFLHALGRIHDVAQAKAAVQLAQRVFGNFNIDLMYALPGQSLADALVDIDVALAFSPPHLSAYHLTLEPHTAFFANPPPLLPDEDLAADMQEAIEGKLRNAGYEHYETAAFARPGHRCAHNLNYWRFGDYLGIGAGAAGKISSASRIRRTMRNKHPSTYMAAMRENAAAGEGFIEDRHVTTGELPFEFMMNRLRLTEGFTLQAFEQCTGLSIAHIQRPLAAGLEQGLLDRDLHRVWPTERGRRMLNQLLTLFM